MTPDALHPVAVKRGDGVCTGSETPSHIERRPALVRFILGKTESDLAWMTKDGSIDFARFAAAYVSYNVVRPGL